MFHVDTILPLCKSSRAVKCGPTLGKSFVGSPFTAGELNNNKQESVLRKFNHPIYLSEREIQDLLYKGELKQHLEYEHCLKSVELIKEFSFANCKLDFLCFGKNERTNDCEIKIIEVKKTCTSESIKQVCFYYNWLVESIRQFDINIFMDKKNSFRLVVPKMTMIAEVFDQDSLIIANACNIDLIKVIVLDKNTINLEYILHDEWQQVPNTRELDSLLEKRLSHV
jgi:hypothetical protein